MTTDAYTFYERLGFLVVRSSPVGTDTPGWDWSQNPIIIYIASTLATPRGRYRLTWRNQMHRSAKKVVESD